LSTEYVLPTVPDTRNAKMNNLRSLSSMEFGIVVL
jgi:hypothetical protein